VRLAAAVREAGALVLKTFGGPIKSWTKQGDSPVSAADIAVNELLHGRLADAATDYGWLSEESENDPARLSKRRVWVVDPIDGTRAYLAGRADWSISAALVEDGRPVVAAVFAPVTDELFVAILGEGATRNAAPMTASVGSDLDGARIAGPRRVLESLAIRRPGLVAMPRIGSLALRLVRLAQGEIEAAIAGGNGHDWDLAAADLLVHEAGGMLTALDGKQLTYNRPDPVHGVLVAAGRERHVALLDLVRAQHDSSA
jgi:myo-inositol-1(or 4)-monophosphatase